MGNQVINGRSHSKQLIKQESHLKVFQFMVKQQKLAFPNNTHTPVRANNYLGWLVHGKVLSMQTVINKYGP